MPKSRQDKGRMYERRVAKATGGRLQPGSGARDHSKCDVVTARFAVECKHTDAAQYTLRRRDIDKARTQALFEGRQWCLRLSVGGREVVVLDAEVLAELSPA